MFFFFFNDTATTEIYTLSLHDALPIWARGELNELRAADLRFTPEEAAAFLDEVMGLQLSAEDVAELETRTEGWRSEEHTSELQSRQYLVCRLLLEKKKTTYTTPWHNYS